MWPAQVIPVCHGADPSIGTAQISGPLARRCATKSSCPSWLHVTANASVHPVGKLASRRKSPPADGTTNTSRPGPVPLRVRANHSPFGDSAKFADASLTIVRSVPAARSRRTIRGLIPTPPGFEKKSDRPSGDTAGLSRREVRDAGSALATVVNAADSRLTCRQRDPADRDRRPVALTRKALAVPRRRRPRRLESKRLMRSRLQG